MPSPSPIMPTSSMPASPAELPLRDIHLPDAISWWPLAPGWWLLLASLILIIAGFAYYRHYRYQRRALHRLQQHLTEIRQQFETQGDAHATIEKLSTMLRRACLSFYPRNDVASLTGDDWLAFLNQRTSNSFSDETGALLVTAPYKKADTLDNALITKLIDTVEQQLSTLFAAARRSQ